MNRSVLFVCQYQSLYAGNFIASLTALAKKLQSRGDRVIFAFGKESAQRDWFSGLSEVSECVELLPGNGIVSNARTIHRLIRKYDVSILHVHFGYMTPARLAALFSPHVKLILHQHSDFSAGKRIPFKKRVLHAGARFLNLLLRSRLINVNVGPGMKSERNTVCIPNALSFVRFDADLSDRDEVRRELGLAPSDTLVLLFGWSPYVKGVDTAVTALGMLPSSSGIKLGVICGRDYTEEKMKRWISDNTGTESFENLLFLPPTDQVFRYHKAADIMLSASRSETFSYSLLEALLSGNPCAVSDIPGTSWSARYPTVKMFSSEDCRSCADTILFLQDQLRSGSFSGALGSVSNQIRSDYDIALWTDKIISLYER